jgi:DNA-binding response OmpR family regulator
MAGQSEGLLRMVKVLVADDDEDQRFLISRVLQRAGFETIPVENGVDVVSVARTERPDVILLDVQMEDQDGFATCRLLKGDPALAATPVVFLSGRLDPQDQLIGQELGAADFLKKSADTRELVSRVKMLAS